MRIAILGALLALAVAACGHDEAIIDGPETPIDAPVDGSPTDGGIDGTPIDGTPIDGSSACAACGPNQVCVAYHDGTCSSNIRVECQDRNAGCQGTTCLQGSDCEFWHCKSGMDAGSPYICYACPNDIAGALNCHGP